MHPQVSKKPPAIQTSSRPLRRGKACVNCRFLKIKCDGVKPICGPCERNPKEDECDYTDVQGRSRTRALEDTIARLETRIKELERPQDFTPSVSLHDPYSNQIQLQPSPASPYTSLSPFSPVSSASSHSFDQGGRGSSSTSASDSSLSFLGTDEPPMVVITTLLDNFLPHASQFGFFLHPTRFRLNALSQFPFGHVSRPSPALLSAVYLWGVHLSPASPYYAHLPLFLSRALQYAGTDLANTTTHPHRVLHLMQAEVLLANYFFRNGRFLEAKCHTSIAVSLALGCNFHRIRSNFGLSPPTIGVLLNLPVLPHPPQDEVDEGERINGFWAVFTLHKTLAVALDPPTRLCGALEASGVLIDTPWPLEMDAYREGYLPPQDAQSTFTVRDFLSEVPRIAPGEFTATAMYVKSAVLFHRAAYLAGQWRPHMYPHEATAFSNAFYSLDRLIQRFREDLPPTPDIGDTLPSSEVRTHIITRALGEAAAIKLHSNFSYSDTSSKHKCLSAARAIVSLGKASLTQLTYMNPIMGTLWSIACHVFIDEISRLRTGEGSLTPTATISGEDALLTNLRDGMSTLSMFASDSALISYQLTRARESYNLI
ncbi:Zinc cluster transcription factor 52 [Pleurotus pulmonarius]